MLLSEGVIPGTVPGTYQFLVHTNNFVLPDCRSLVTFSPCPSPHNIEESHTDLFLSCSAFGLRILLINSESQELNRCSFLSSSTSCSVATMTQMSRDEIQNSFMTVAIIVNRADPRRYPEALTLQHRSPCQQTLLATKNLGT